MLPGRSTPPHLHTTYLSIKSGPILRLTESIELETLSLTFCVGYGRYPAQGSTRCKVISETRYIAA